MDRAAAPTPVDNGEAVMAHGLLNSMAVVVTGVSTLRDRWSGLSPSNRDDLFERVLAHAAFVTDALSELTRGLPEGALGELDGLRAQRNAQR